MSKKTCKKSVKEGIKPALRIGNTARRKKAAQYPVVLSGKERNKTMPDGLKNAVLPLVAAKYVPVKKLPMETKGIEPSPLTSSKTAISENSGAKSGALDSAKPLHSNKKLRQEQKKKHAKESSPSSADLPEDLQKLLQKLTTSWDDLPGHVKTTLMTLVGLHR